MRSPMLDLIHRTIAGLAGGTAADGLAVRISRRGHRGIARSWEGSTRDLAQHVHTALTGSSDRQPPAPASTLLPGDLVHLHYPDALDGQGWGETYIVTAEDGGLATGLRLVFQPATRDGSGLNAPAGYDGRYEFYGPADPLARPLAELGRDQVTVVRNGAVIPTPGS